MLCPPKSLNRDKFILTKALTLVFGQRLEEISSIDYCYIMMVNGSLIGTGSLKFMKQEHLLLYQQNLELENSLKAYVFSDAHEVIEALNRGKKWLINTIVLDVFDSTSCFEKVELALFLKRL